jgi:hypothetical protein
MIRFSCPRCGKRLKAEPSYAGRRVRCVRCRERLITPQTGEFPDVEILDEEATGADPVGEVHVVVDPVARQAGAGGKPGRLKQAVDLDEPPELEPDLDFEDRPRKKKRGKKRRRSGGVTAGAALAVALILAVVWVGMGVAGWFFRPVSIAMFVVGVVVVIVGRRWLLALAREEGAGTYYCCLLVPFYDTYFTFSRLHRTWAPCLICWAGRAFTVVALVLLFIHTFRHEVAGVEDRLSRVAGQVKAADDDAQCEQLLAAPNQAEAKAWLGEPNKRRGFFKWGREAPLKFVNDLYAKGAKKVTVAEIENDPDLGEVGTHLVVTLPDEPARRKAVLDLINEQFADEDEPRKDHGQKYELLTPG